ncbi:neuropeptide [Echinococcus multilocularis]|uniref:Neuropeptide n=1 Tax=Echinococcus multilocularis TaxID=6211 RepID=A0A087W1L9_ECHMU|nr:neuropeptide [Echinococcus multilocularis]
MKAFYAILFTVLAMIVLTITAEEPKSHEEDKRMLYWKRDGLEDLDDEELGTYGRIIPFLKMRNRFGRLHNYRKRMVYW